MAGGDEIERDMDVVAELAATLSTEDLMAMIEGMEEYFRDNEPSFFEKVGRAMCGD